MSKAQIVTTAGSKGGIGKTVTLLGKPVVYQTMAYFRMMDEGLVGPNGKRFLRGLWNGLVGDVLGRIDAGNPAAAEDAA